MDRFVTTMTLLFGAARALMRRWRSRGEGETMLIVQARNVVPTSAVTVLLQNAADAGTAAAAAAVIAFAAASMTPMRPVRATRRLPPPKLIQGCNGVGVVAGGCRVRRGRVRALAVVFASGGVDGCRGGVLYLCRDLVCCLWRWCWPLSSDGAQHSDGVPPRHICRGVKARMRRHCFALQRGWDSGGRWLRWCFHNRRRSRRRHTRHRQLRNRRRCRSRRR